MNKRTPETNLVIDVVTTQQLTKKELLEAIDRTFPDERTFRTGKIVTVISTKMRTGEVKQSVIFGLDLEV